MSDFSACAASRTRDLLRARMIRVMSWLYKVELALRPRQKTEGGLRISAAEVDETKVTVHTEGRSDIRQDDVNERCEAVHAEPVVGRPASLRRSICCGGTGEKGDVRRRRDHVRHRRTQPNRRIGDCEERKSRGLTRFEAASPVSQSESDSCGREVKNKPDERHEGGWHLPMSAN